jgi:hypothetical protein
MTTGPLPVRRPAPTDRGDTLIHLVCCNPGRGECGADTSTAAWLPALSGTSRDCVVCLELEQRPTCGAWWCRPRRWWRALREDWRDHTW